MRKGDKIYLVVNKNVSYCEVVGFRCYCTELKAGNLRVMAAKFNKGLFYGYGYDHEERYLFLNKLWHFYLAVIIEKIRISLTHETAKKLKLER